jgi:FtsP/CotA-like multicopper oxidase with cupredoxin domain
MNRYTKIMNFASADTALHTLFAQRVVHYELYVKDTLVNYAGKQKRAIAVNGQIPMPTLTFTEGDTAEIVVHNQLKESTSLHWHGVFLPNKEDGVPWLTQKPIAPAQPTPTVFRLSSMVRTGIIPTQDCRSRLACTEVLS